MPSPPLEVPTALAVKETRVSPTPAKEPSVSAQTSEISSGQNTRASAPELQEYTHLRERYLRTTNALASAAHDLKTPLAILNGYVELLQSEKLGGLNDRQRE